MSGISGIRPRIRPPITMTIGYGVPSLRARSPKTTINSSRRRKTSSISPIPVIAVGPLFDDTLYYPDSSGGQAFTTIDRTASMNRQLHFGYPWWLSYGHLIVAGLTSFLFLIGYKRRWSRVGMVLLGVLALWSSAAFVATRFLMDVNGRASLPTENFLRSGTGRVLDMGAGTGRSSIMVLEARPQTTLVALDLFGNSYVQHFGHGSRPEERLLDNLKIAGVERGATIQAGDMRKLPFEASAFDAIVSSYAIDHLNSAGVQQSLAEAERVLKPGGEFLLMVIGKDPWLQFTFGPLLLHHGTHGADWWIKRLQQARFQVVEHGMRPATLYLLSRKL